MNSPKLEAALSNQLTAEFGVHGESAVDSLAAAESALRLDRGLLRRRGATVAYHLRDALVEIPKASGVGGGLGRNALSEAVIESVAQYKHSVDLSDDEMQIARQAMFLRVDELKSFLDEPESIHQVRLRELFRQRTGTEPLSSGTAPLREYQQLLDDCNRAGHNNCTLDEARRLWTECINLLQRLFLAHERDPEPLRRLAGVESPTRTDLDQLLGSLSTSVELQSFLRVIDKPGWLWLLGRSDALGSPGSSLWWAASTAATRVSDAHRVEVVRWLEAMHSEHVAEADHARCFAYAARRIAGDALDLLFAIVRRHPTDERIALEGLNAALKLDARDPMVLKLANALLNVSSWDLLHVADRLTDHVADGIDAANALDRIEQVSFKLRQVDDDLAIGVLRLFPEGTMDDAHTAYPHDRASVLLGCVTRMLRRAWDWHPASALLRCVDTVPGVVRERLRAWILGNASDVDPDALASEVATAIVTRDATGDDVALVQRAIDLGDSESLRSSWLDALGDVPDVEQVRLAIDGEALLPESLWRARSWIGILPESFAGTWAGPCQLLDGALGEVNREQMLTRTLPQVRTIGSPMDAQHFAGMSPTDAAATIARWRPDPDNADFYVSARGLSGVLQELVEANPADWLSDPVAIVRALHHPTHISAYLRAAETTEDKSAANHCGLLDAAKLVESEPWQATPIGRDRHRYEPDWREARRAATELIGTLASTGEWLADRADEAWELIENAARRLPHRHKTSRSDDHLFQADVVASARALELALLVANAEIQASKPTRPELERLLDYSLQLRGDLGFEHRRVIAPRIFWLQRRLPTWTASAMTRIIGDDAPEGLGSTTFELILLRTSPSQWLCETYPDMFHDAARLQQERAIDHVLIAMLWDWKGHSVEAVTDFLERHTELIPEAAECLAKLLRGDEVNPSHLATAVAFWEMLLDSGAARHGARFGWMSIVTALEDKIWSELTRRTIEATRGQYGWDDEVADRAMTAPLTVDKLAILDLLVRHSPSDWVRQCIADKADTLLGVGPDLADTPEFVRLRTALLGHGLVAAG